MNNNYCAPVKLFTSRWTRFSAGHVSFPKHTFSNSSPAKSTNDVGMILWRRNSDIRVAQLRQICRSQRGGSSELISSSIDRKQHRMKNKYRTFSLDLDIVSFTSNVLEDPVPETDCEVRRRVHDRETYDVILDTIHCAMLSTTPYTRPPTSRVETTPEMIIHVILPCTRTSDKGSQWSRRILK